MYFSCEYGVLGTKLLISQFWYSCWFFRMSKVWFLNLSLVSHCLSLIFWFSGFWLVTACYLSLCLWNWNVLCDSSAQVNIYSWFCVSVDLLGEEKYIYLGSDFVNYIQKWGLPWKFPWLWLLYRWPFVLSIDRNKDLIVSYQGASRSKNGKYIAFFSLLRLIHRW